MPQTIGVVGLGYVGLTLTAALADKGYTVHGADVSHHVLDTLSQGRSHIFEPGVEDIFASRINSGIHVGESLPNNTVDVAVISVSTPVDEQTRRPNLANLAAAARSVAATCAPGTLVVVRSTVPVGTSRKVVLPELRAAWGDDVKLVMAPERTIQGQALRELVELPQVVGGLDDASLQAGLEFFGGLANTVVPVSDLETAELVKLSNNCHTDLIYSFGNEIALIAEQHGLDPLEVIKAANVDYPRPDLSKPGYVGGGCLSKDPYIMLDSAGDYTPFLVGQARALNEYLPKHVAEIVVRLLREIRGETRGLRLAVLGWAYKGWPPTDDMRGTPIATMMPIFSAAGITVTGHDPMVTAEVVRQYGGDPVSLDKAFTDSDAVLVINDHPDYRAVDVNAMLGDARPALIFDSWRILDADAVRAAGIRYAGLGLVAA
ncbi:NDP-sugar dehydrogenase [Paractinoplanes abujensis]|uniref:UDP-N-acetyl-D-mannosaminuronic acid dehydrogenase n=1 Tax=Paractinoplanes abujensis TaxID=882441 RepID=A0A7W7G1V3_9ACTN|nr:nucleotide sugar dehydrogenase [Actinoplanes abujensis]MBB4691031.1 UDP-N-acetyl-D-mannosaminuronic acid dehydrogenase [Actinoplanes abujensis]GID17556.1 NDP-sugar dehydrogenase [Actinoplanes abujensis]